MKNKVYNKYRIGETVLIQSQQYVYGKVVGVTIRNNQHSYKVETNKAGKHEILNKLPEEALLPYESKRMWKFKNFLSRIGIFFK